MRCSRGRSKHILAALTILVIFMLSGSAGAQGLFGIGLPGLPSFGGGGASDLYRLGSFEVRSDARVGYGHMGLNFNLPVGDPLATPLDLSFRNANMAIGSVGVSVESSSGVFLALRASANASRHILVQTPESVLGPVTWDGSRMQWWMLDGYAGYRFKSCWSVLAGLRRDQVSVSLTDPVTADGFPLNFLFVIPGDLTVSNQYHGDFSSRLWVPYVGLQIAGQRFRANLLYSPIASADTKIPIGNLLAVLFVAPPLTLLEGNNLEFQVRDSTRFVEFNFDYDVNVTRDLSCQLWFTGNWMRLRSGGDLDSIFRVFVTPPIPPIDLTFSESGDGRATYTRSLIAGGVAAVLSF